MIAVYLRFINGDGEINIFIDFSVKLSHTDVKKGSSSSVKGNTHIKKKCTQMIKMMKNK